MRDLRSSDRRRRIRLIKAVEERSTKRFRSAVTALAIASDTESTRIDLEVLRRKLLTECRLKPSTRLRVEHPGAAPIDVRMDLPTLIIGSDPGCDLHLDHDEIRPRHFLLQWIDGHIFCCDIAPRTSLFPDRNATSNGQWVELESIPLGPYRLRLLDEDEDVATIPDYSPLDRSPKLASEYPLLALQFLGVEQTDNVWAINRPLTLIGRSSQCRLRLNHKSIAPVQGCLLRTSTGCWLIDLVNDGTTGINERAIQISPVDVGDILQLGSFRVEVVTMDVPANIPSTDSNSETPFKKALPPIKFDRPPKAPQRPAAPDAEAAMQNLSSTSLVQANFESMVTANSLTMHADLSHVMVVEEQTPVHQISADTSFPKPIQRTIDHRLVEQGPVEFRSLERSPVEHRPSEHSPVIQQPDAEARSIEVSKTRHQPTDVGHSTGNQPESREMPLMTFTTVAEDRLTVADEKVAEFIKQQQSQLATLKQKLDALKEIYDTATGQLISKKMRDKLEVPVLETMRCHDSMQEVLSQFLQSIE